MVWIIWAVWEKEWKVWDLLQAEAIDMKTEAQELQVILSTLSVGMMALAKASWSHKKTLPEAQRTQGIESMTWIIFSTGLNLYSIESMA